MASKTAGKRRKNDTEIGGRRAATSSSVDDGNIAPEEQPGYGVTTVNPDETFPNHSDGIHEYIQAMLGAGATNDEIKFTAERISNGTRFNVKITSRTPTHLVLTINEPSVETKAHDIELTRGSRNDQKLSVLYDSIERQIKLDSFPAGDELSLRSATPWLYAADSKLVRAFKTYILPVVLTLLCAVPFFNVSAQDLVAVAILAFEMAVFDVVLLEKSTTKAATVAGAFLMTTTAYGLHLIPYQSDSFFSLFSVISASQLLWLPGSTMVSAVQELDEGLALEAAGLALKSLGTIVFIMLGNLLGVYAMIRLGLDLQPLDSSMPNVRFGSTLEHANIITTISLLVFWTLGLLFVRGQFSFHKQSLTRPKTIVTALLTIIITVTAHMWNLYLASTHVPPAPRSPPAIVKDALHLVSTCFVLSLFANLFSGVFQIPVNTLMAPMQIILAPGTYALKLTKDQWLLILHIMYPPEDFDNTYGLPSSRSLVAFGVVFFLNAMAIASGSLLAKAVFGSQRVPHYKDFFSYWVNPAFWRNWPTRLTTIWLSLAAIGDWIKQNINRAIILGCAFFLSILILLDHESLAKHGKATSELVNTTVQMTLPSLTMNDTLLSPVNISTNTSIL